MRCYSLHVHQHRSYTYLYLKSRERLTRTPRHFITPQLACMCTLIHTHTHANASCRRACTTSTWHNHGRRYLRSAAPRELCVSSALWARLSDVPRAPPWAQRRLWVSPHRPMPPPPTVSVCASVAARAVIAIRPAALTTALVSRQWRRRSRQHGAPDDAAVCGALLEVAGTTHRPVQRPIGRVPGQAEKGGRVG